MTKRFTFEIKTTGNKAYTQWYDDGKPINSAKNVIDLLNEQHETIQSLISDSEKYRKLSMQFDNRNNELVSENALLEKENEQLKSEIKDLNDILARYEEKELEMGLL